HRQAASQSQEPGAHEASAALNPRASGGVRRLSRVARRASSQARLPISFHENQRQPFGRHFYFQLARQTESGGFPDGHFHLWRRADLRTGVAPVLGSLFDAREAN